MCWIEKDHDHTCPWCIKDFEAEGSGEEIAQGTTLRKQTRPSYG